MGYGHDCQLLTLPGACRVLPLVSLLGEAPPIVGGKEP